MRYALLAILLAAFLSAGFASASERLGQVAVLLRLSHDGRFVAQDDELARDGSYHELAADGLDIRYRFSSVTSDTAHIDIDVFRNGNVIARPGVVVGLEASATVSFGVNSEKGDGSMKTYELEFRLDDRRPPPPKPLLPAGGEPAPVPD